MGLNAGNYRTIIRAALASTTRDLADLVEKGALKGEDRFAATAWRAGETGMPLLDGSLGSFECKRHAVHDGGDNFLLVGEVVRAQFEPRRDPLLYFRGKYRRLHFA